tara:strand:- start:414 stop:602 length:189 start_codon:yes stop_codon:yes gene_type:complete
VSARDLQPGDENLTVARLRELPEGVPDETNVVIYFEGAVGDAVEAESPGYDAERGTFAVGCR